MGPNELQPFSLLLGPGVNHATGISPRSSTGRRERHLHPQTVLLFSGEEPIKDWIGSYCVLVSQLAQLICGSPARGHQRRADK